MIVQVWNISDMMLTDQHTGWNETALQVLYSVCSYSHAVRISCINSSVDFTLGTCS